MSKLKILLHDEVQLMDYGESRAGGPWIKVRLNDVRHLDIFRGLDVIAGNMKKTGHILNMTLSQGDIIPAEPAQFSKEEIEAATKDNPAPMQFNRVQLKEKGIYGEDAKTLRLSQFFYTPAVWMAVGTDEDFLAWCRQQPCAFARAKLPPLNDWPAGCSGSVVAAHVRRVANGAGTGIKPPYSAIACCDQHHQIQHSMHGEAHFGGPEVFDKLRIQAVSGWCWQTLRLTLGYESWTEVPPYMLRLWAEENGVSEHLPELYRNATGPEEPFEDGSGEDQ